LHTCIICRFSTELDDVVTRGRGGRCICLRCFGRETGSDRPMPRELRRDVIAALNQIEAP
jgi:hypothetical protein